MNTTVAPAVWYARILGIVLTIVGLIGLSVTTDQETVKQLAGLDINLTHNIVHLATGVLGLLVGFMWMSSARLYAILVGIVYLIVGVWGFVDADPMGLFGNINDAGNYLHLVLGVLGLAAWAKSQDHSAERAA
jgi:hypothetical protein